MYRILIVEDDNGIADGISRVASSWGMECAAVTDFRDVMGEFERMSPHLVLLDIALPFFNGYHWCSEIRRVSRVPVIFISSASDNMNIVMAMNMGADDFIAKPFDVNVLMAKIQAMLRRSYDFSMAPEMMEYKGVVLETGEQVLRFNNEKVDLTKNEYRILYCLMQNKCKVVSRDRLMQSLWETDSYVDDNTLTVNINRLRKKLEQCGINDFITTKVGSGYIIA
ncbi:MAG: response regulator transcription factor [Eubacteriales bacterium]|nr:response regulator transcription factor [Eubacteriales bacterium]